MKYMIIVCFIAMTGLLAPNLVDKKRDRTLIR